MNEQMLLSENEVRSVSAKSNLKVRMLLQRSRGSTVENDSQNREPTGTHALQLGTQDQY